MNVLSLFDGISCGQLALQRANVNYDNYFASEIDQYATKVTHHHFPDTIQLGDVKNVSSAELPKIDLLMGGSPCQGFSFAGKQLNFDDPRSKLFFEFVRLLEEIKPKYFLLENVKMKKQSRDIISKYLGVEPILINSALVSAQSRNRYYWTNIDFPKIEDKKIHLRDVIENYKDSKISSNDIETQIKRLLENSKYRNNFRWQFDKQGRILVMRPDGLKIQRIGRVGFGMHKSEIITCVTQPHIFDGDIIRKVSILEAERLQNIPDKYTDVGLSNSRRYKCIGNSWTVDVISHIVKSIN